MFSSFDLQNAAACEDLGKYDAEPDTQKSGGSQCVDTGNGNVYDEIKEPSEAEKMVRTQVHFSAMVYRTHALSMCRYYDKCIVRL